MLSQPLPDSGPAAPVAISFDGESISAAAVTLPEPRPPPPPAPARGKGRLLTWTIDSMAVAALLCAAMTFTIREARIRYPLDFVRDTASLWLLLLAAVSLTYSLIFAAARRLTDPARGR